MLLWLLACADPTVDLDFDPDVLAFGSVPYTSDMPEEGFAQLEQAVENEGEEVVVLSLAPYDEQWFCIEGFPNQNEVQELGPINPGSVYLLKVGICDHAPGTFDQDQELTLDFLTDGDPGRFTLVVTLHPILVVE